MRYRPNSRQLAETLEPRDTIVCRLRPDGSVSRSLAHTERAAVYALSKMPALLESLEHLATVFVPELLEVHDDDGNRVGWLEPAP